MVIKFEIFYTAPETPNSKPKEPFISVFVLETRKLKKGEDKVSVWALFPEGHEPCPRFISVVIKQPKENHSKVERLYLAYSVR